MLEQRAALEQLLVTQQQSVQQIFADHQSAMESLLSRQPQQRPMRQWKEPETTGPSANAARTLTLQGYNGISHQASTVVSSDEEGGVVFRTESRQRFVPRNSIQQYGMLIVQSTWFQCLTTAAIIANTVYLGAHINLETQHVLKSLQNGEAPHLDRASNDLNLVFFIMFLLEIGFRLIAEQDQFCCGPGKYWNVFDLVVLVSMAVEQLPVPKSALAIGNISPLRFFRLVRIFRALRAVRLFEHFKQLRLMLYSVASCLMSMFWATALLLLVNCIFALYLEDAAVVYLLENHDRGPVEKRNEYKLVQKQLVENWNGMGSSVRSLIYSISGGADWGALADPFFTIGTGCGTSYIGFIILTIFGLLNILVGIFVQEAEEISKWDKDFVDDVAAFVQKRKDKEQTIQELYDFMDNEQKGMVTMQRLEESLLNDHVVAQFEQLEVSVEKVDLLMRVIDVDGNGLISREEFTDGLHKLTGRANATDVAEVLLEEQKTNAKMDNLKESICRRIDVLTERVSVLQGGGSISRGSVSITPERSPAPHHSSTPALQQQQQQQQFVQPVHRVDPALVDNQSIIQHLIGLQSQPIGNH